MQLPDIPWTAAGGWALRALSWVRTRWRRARLRIYFDPAETYHVRRVVDYNNQLGRFCHFMVRNEGKEIARQCRVRLMAVGTLTPQGPVPVEDFVAPRTLKWAHEPDWDPRDIEPDVRRRADLCYAVDGTPLLIFFTTPMPSGVRTIFPPGTYRVRVRVDSENAERDEATYDIAFDGTWQTVHVIPVP
jgi:hypothetical protein